jgi:hypothetical protein
MRLYGYFIQMTSNIHFTPVPRAKDRADGWTPEKQADFIEALSETGTVTAAAAKVGMGTTSAYNLRKSPGAASFAEAWDAAQRTGFARLQDIAMDRAINGVSVPHYYKGELVGEGRWYDNRLLMFMMRQTMTRRYGPRAGEFDLHETVLRHERAEKQARAQFAQKLRDLETDFESSLVFEEECNDERSPAIVKTIHKGQDLVSAALVRLENEALRQEEERYW